MSEKRKKNVSYNAIQNINEDWALDERNGYPYSGESVQAFIKDSLNGKGGEFYFDADTTRYLIFANADNRDLYLSDREQYADLIIGTFDAPANYTAEISTQTPTNNVVMEGETGNYIDFTFDVKSRSGASTGEDVVATYTFSNAGNTRRVTQIYPSGTNVHFLADQYLDSGTNTISIVVTGRNSLVSTMAAVNYTVVSLSLTSSFNFSQAIPVGEYLSIPYVIDGAGVKYIEWYIDGTKLDVIDTVSDIHSTRTKNIDTTQISVGKHNVQARAYISSNANTYYSNTLYFDFVVSPSNGIWTDNYTYVLLGLILSQPSSGTLSISATQYKSFDYNAAVYDTRHRTLDMIVSDNGTQVQSVSMQDAEVRSLSYTPQTAGAHTLTFTADGSTASISVTVDGGEIDIEEATEGVAIRLSAKGRSNQETNPGSWSDHGIGTTFTGFDWNEQSGWSNNSLVIPAGASINVGISPLAGNVVSTGKTIEIDLETSNITNENAQILAITNSNTNAGLTITASTASLRSSGGKSVNTKYRDGDRVHLAFIINRTTGDDARMMYIVNNGILERAERFDATDNFTADSSMIIGSTGCTVKVRSIRVYNRALTVDEAFCNYAVDSDNLVEIASENDIFDPQTGAISADKVNAHIPIMIITGDISYILGISDKSQKNAWNTYPVQIEYRNMQNPEMNFFLDDADIRLQGTSSISYPRKNFRIYSISKSGKYNTKLYSPTHSASDLVASGKYAFKQGSAPVSCWCLKADYAESSGSHNAGVAKLWNQVMYNANVSGTHPLRTMAQTWADQHNYPYDVRTTIDGFPIVLFQRDSENAPLTCLGQYNFNNDKSTEDVFGFTALSVKDSLGNTETFDNSHVECWEVLDSDNQIALFTNVSNFDSGWGDAFEARYPDKNTNTTALKRVAQFINSCYQGMSGDTMQVNLTTWRSGKADYFDLPKLAAYYVYLLRMGAVDQTVKNAMFTTEDGQHWFYINYDNDTILGIDNASHQFDTWDYDLKSKIPGQANGWYYAGKGMSVLWNCFEADSECMALARQIDEVLFAAGFTYEAICRMFDEEQSGKWCERIYNANGRYKYIEQALLGQEVLYMLQGSRESHRHWFLQHRLEKYDNAFGNGTYTRRSIQARSTSTVNIPQGASYKFTPAITSYFGYGVASTTVDAPTQRTAGTEYTSTGLPQATGVGNLIYIYNANNIDSLDMSGYISALGVLNVSSAVDVNGNSKLRKIKLGDGENTNTFLTNISGLATQQGIEELDIRGYQGITSMEFNQLPNLHVLHAENSGLTSFSAAEGAILTNVYLPSVLQGIALKDVTVNGFTYTPTKTLNNVSLRNVGGSWDVKSFINTWLALFADEELVDLSLTLTNINWTGMTAAQVLKMGKVGTRSLQGKVVLTSINAEQYNQIIEVFGPSVFTPSSSFVIEAGTGSFIDGPTQVSGGTTDKYQAAFFPVSSDQPKYLLYIGSQLITPTTDGQGRVYREHGGVKLYQATGVIEAAANISQEVTLRVRAQLGDTLTYTDYITVVCRAMTYPNIIIDGRDTIGRPGSVNYTKSFNPSEFSAEVTNVHWTVDCDSSIATITDTEGGNATLGVVNVPSSGTTIQVLCTVTFEGNVTRTQTKSVSLMPTIPASISITGPATIQDTEDYLYEVQVSPYDSSGDYYSAQAEDFIWYVSDDSIVDTYYHPDAQNKTYVCATENNATQTTVTLTYEIMYPGNRKLTATKEITIGVITDAPTDEFVDLGLRSGTLWAKKNVGATNPWDNGLYFAWGETTGYASATARNTALSKSGGFDSTAYNAGSAASISGNLTDEQDAAFQILGGDYAMPTLSQIQELIDTSNTATKWTTRNGVPVLKVMKLTDMRKYILLPCSGYYNGNTFIDGKTSPDHSHFWGKSLALDTTKARSLEAHYNTSETPISYSGFDLTIQHDLFWDDNNRYLGMPIRPVKRDPEWVDLGLPSGNLWRKSNLGTDTPSAIGNYYAWGEMSGYANSSARNTALSRSDGFSQEAYSAVGAYNIETDLDLQHDAANRALGGDEINGQCAIPSTVDFQELIDNTDQTWGKLDDVWGYYFYSKTDSRTKIFIPITGYYNGNNLEGSADAGRYWVSTISSQPGNAQHAIMTSSSPSAGQFMSRNYGLAIRPIKKPVPEWIDFGLPSGNLWRRMNLGATLSTESGLYYAWGETTGYVDANARVSALGGSFVSASYETSGGAAITDSTLTLAHDAANRTLGGMCCMPNIEDIQELYDNTDSELTTINGVSGRKIMKKNNHSVYIFIPAVGHYSSGTSLRDGTWAGFWSSSAFQSNPTDYAKAYLSNGNNNTVAYNFTVARYEGYPIRPIKKQIKFVDLGLPSGLLWADKNIGAVSETDDGYYFQWGDTVGHTSSEGYNFSSSNYSAKGLNNISADLMLSQDAANAYLGGSCRMPTKTETQELYNNTRRSFESNNGVNGVRFTSKTNGNSIFFPASGYYSDKSLDYSGSSGYCWSSSYWSDVYAYYFKYSSSSEQSADALHRRYGFTVRAVR